MMEGSSDFSELSGSGADLGAIPPNQNSVNMVHTSQDILPASPLDSSR